MSELGGVDFSKYGTWEKLQAPTGQIYYVVPGTGYVYDPFLSQAKGRPVLFQNPKPAYDKRKKQEEQAENAASPLGQAIPIIGATAGTIGSQYAINALGPATAQEKLAEEMTKQIAAENAAKIPLTTGDAFVGPLMQDGSVAPPVEGLGITPYLGLAGAGLGAYGLYNATQMEGRRKAGTAGALSGASLGAGLGAAAPLLFGASAALGPVGLGLMALGGAGLGGALGGVFGRQSTKEQQAERWNNIGMEAPDMVDYFQGTGGEKSRDEALLTPDAIRVNPDNYNNVPEWDSWSKDMQDKFLSQLLSEKKVSERKGGIYYDDARAKEIAAEIRMGKELADRANAKGK